MNKNGASGRTLRDYPLQCGLDEIAEIRKIDNKHVKRNLVSSNYI